MVELIGKPPSATTRKGNVIPMEPGYSIGPQDIATTHALELRTFGGSGKCQVRKSPSGQYNCHGLTFLSRRGFLHPDHIPLILEDDDYYEVTAPEVMSGDIAIYYEFVMRSNAYEISHTGIVAWVQRYESGGGMAGQVVGDPVIWIVSKWQNSAEYIHHSDTCPYKRNLSDKIKYMREGKNDKPAVI